MKSQQRLLMLSGTFEVNAEMTCFLKKKEVAYLQPHI